MKWGKMFSKVHFFKAFPFFKVDFFRYSYVHFDLYSNVWSIFRQKMTKYVVEYMYYTYFWALATGRLGFEIFSSPKCACFSPYSPWVTFKKPYYSEILPYYGRIWNFSKPYYSEIRTDRNRTMRGLPVVLSDFVWSIIFCSISVYVYFCLFLCCRLSWILY